MKRCIKFSTVVTVLCTMLLSAGCEPAATPSSGSTTGAASPAETVGEVGDTNETGDDTEEQPGVAETVTLTAVAPAAYEEAIEKYKGQVVVVDYWATWCSMCCALLPHTVELARQHQDSKDVKVITVSMDTAKFHDQAVEFLNEQKAIPTLNLRADEVKFEAENLDAMDLTEQTLPYVKVYDRQGKLVATFADVEATHENIEKAVAEALKAE